MCTHARSHISVCVCSCVRARMGAVCLSYCQNGLPRSTIRPHTTHLTPCTFQLRLGGEEEGAGGGEEGRGAKNEMSNGDTQA